MIKVDNLIDLKKKNLKCIIDYQRFRGNCTKKQIANDLNLSFATVSNMMNYLMQIDLVRNAEYNSSKYVGRSPKYFNFNPKRFQILTFDLHDRQLISIYVIDLARNILFHDDYPIQMISNIDQYMGKFSESFNNFIHIHGIDMESVISAGVVTPGNVDEKQDCIIGTENVIFQNKPIRKLINQIIGKQVVVENDANLAASFAAAVTQTKNLIYLYISNGLGLGTITNGNILRGANGYSSEIAHVPLGRIHRKCPYCGNYDCIQTDTSRNGFLSKYYGKEFPLGKIYKKEWESFIECIRSNDPKAVEVSRENGSILGKTLATAASILRPEKIVIGGIPVELFQIIVEIIENEINSREHYNPYIQVIHDNCCLDSMAKGAAELLYSRWYPDIDEFKVN